MSAFNNKLEIKEKDGIITNIDEIRSILDENIHNFTDEEYQYIESLISYLLLSNIKNRFKVIDILNKYRYSNKLNSNEEAVNYLNVIFSTNLGIIPYKRDKDITYYIYYYEDNELKILECLQKYDLANYVNTYSKNFNKESNILGGYIKYLKENLNYDPLPRICNIDEIEENKKCKIKEYLNRKNISEYKMYVNSDDIIFIISGSSIIMYDNDELHFIKSEDIFQNKLVNDYIDYESIPILLPFEIDINRLDYLIDNVESISSYDRRYLESSIKTILEKSDSFDGNFFESLNKYVSVLREKETYEEVILTKTEKEILARAENVTETVKKEKRFNSNGGFVIILMELMILGTYLLTFIVLAK